VDFGGGRMRKKMTQPSACNRTNQTGKERQKMRRSYFLSSPFSLLKMHPLFLAVGIWYAFTGELFLFFISSLVVLQHECAHAFAAHRLGYKLNRIVLMPFGAVIDGDLKGISFKDEIFVALCGPLCNLATAIFFVALWWFVPTMYAFTDTAFFSSLSIALVNFLPAYPLDGGRILYCSLARLFSKTQSEQAKAERKAKLFCRIVTLLFSTAFLLAFFLQCAKKTPNFTLLAFGLFLFVGSFGNKDKTAVYEKIDLSFFPPLKKGVELRRVAILASCPIKDAFRFLARGSYLVLEVYDEQENFLFELPQSRLSKMFTLANTPYESLHALWLRTQKD
jgi:stage IV sporulation protein FB